MSFSPDRDMPVLRDILRQAGDTEIMPRFRTLADADITEKKSSIDLVTDADLLAEKYITARLSERFPDALIVGEEACEANPGLITALADAELAFTIDPVDGTFNFSAGLPVFGTITAVVVKGETVAGLIYDPIGNDWAIVEKGSGSWMCKPDGSQEQMFMRPSQPLEQMIGIANTGYFDIETRRKLLVNLADVRLFTSYRCAAHEYRLLAQGHMDFAMYNKLMPWDHLAGALLMQEAGGHVARLDGSAYLPHHTDGGLLVAADEDTWQELREKIFTV